MIKEKYQSKVIEQSISIKDGHPQSVRNKSITKTGFRVYDNNEIGIVGAIGKFNEEEKFNQAKNNLIVEYKPQPSKNLIRSVNNKSEKTNFDNFYSQICSLLTRLRTEFSDYIFSNTVSLREEHELITNDCGLSLLNIDRNTNIGIIYKHKLSLDMFDGYIWYLKRYIDEDNILKAAHVLLDNFRNNVTIPNGRYKIAYFKESFPFEFLAREFGADKIMTGGGLLSDKIGKKIFNENFSFKVDFKNNPGVPFFDMEGTTLLNDEYYLIKNGVFVTPYSDKRSALKYNIPATGSGYSAYDSVPASAFAYLTIEGGNKTIAEYCGDDKVILVFVSSGGDFTSSGDYGAPIQTAYLMEKGKLIGRLPSGKITSNVFKMFGDDYLGKASDKLFDVGSDELYFMYADFEFDK